jgi:Type I phosphodiesterase / nucleotide pyrophosphatase
VTTRKLIVAVVDGLGPAALEAAMEAGEAPTFARLVEHGTYGRAVSVFPSLTPVCLSSIATGAGPDVHGIPHLVWYHRGERRLVEYGSSFGALRTAGVGQTMRDALVNMNAAHLSADAVTMFEAVDDAGFATAAVNFTVYRGRTEHQAAVPFLGPVRGPRRFFFYNVWESDRTGAPLSWRSRSNGSVDAYAAATARWLVTRDGFDLLVYYLSDYDYASHADGPDGARAALRRADDALGELAIAAGGLDELLERYVLVVLADHGQTRVRDTAQLQRRYAEVPGALVTASNRAGMVYRLPGCRLDPRELAALVDTEPSVEVALFREDDEAVARRQGEELRFAPEENGGWRTSGDASVLIGPHALRRSWSALSNPNAGEVLLSAAEGWEFDDLGGSNHVGGGSHGSLAAGDSEVPVVTVGTDARIDSITDVLPLVARHFGVQVPASAGTADRAA